MDIASVHQVQSKITSHNVFLSFFSGLKTQTAYNLNVAMPLAQFADPWRKVHLKGEPEVIYLTYLMGSIDIVVD